MWTGLWQGVGFIFLNILLTICPRMAISTYIFSLTIGHALPSPNAPPPWQQTMQTNWTQHNSFEDPPGEVMWLALTTSSWGCLMVWDERRRRQGKPYIRKIEFYLFSFLKNNNNSWISRRELETFNSSLDNFSRWYNTMTNLDGGATLLQLEPDTESSWWPEVESW